MNEWNDIHTGDWPAVEILVLNWNGRGLLQRYLPPLTQLDYPGAYHIMLVDNGSTDDSLAFVQAQYPQIRIIANGENLGFSRGMNQGLRQTTADVVVLLNTDVEVRPDWLTELVRPLYDDPAIGVTGSRLYFPDGRTLQHAGAMLEYPLAIARHRFYRQPDTGQVAALCDVDYVTGAAMAIRRPVLTAIGLLDEAFSPFYYEEVDFCRRAVAAGFRVVYAPASVAIHHESLSTGQRRDQQFYDLNRNRLLYVLKHYSPTQFLNDFVPAEAAHLAAMPFAHQVQLLRRVYLQVLLTLSDVPLPTSEWPAYQQVLADLAQQASQTRKRHIMDDYWLLEKSEVQERPFTSHSPLIGPLIAWVRTQWNNVATKWYVRPLLQQQNVYNQLVAQTLQDHDGRLIAQDHDQTDLTRCLAELTLQMKQMNHLLASVDQRLAALEETVISKQ